MPIFKTIMLSLALAASASSLAATPTTQDGVTTIHLDEYNGYFSARETLTGLKPGKHAFVVTNRSDKLVGFQLQDAGDQSQLAIFPLEPGQSQTEIVEIDADGFRYRCPINPTPWYDVAVAK